MGVLQETKIMDRFYTCKSDGYSVVATDAPIQHRGGVAGFYQASPWFTVEAIQTVGPNVVSFQMVTGEWRWYIIGCYLAPDNASVI